MVNEISKNIYGWNFTSNGTLHPVAASNRKLTAVTPAGKKDKVGVAAGIGFAPTAPSWSSHSAAFRAPMARSTRS